MTRGRIVVLLVLGTALLAVLFARRPGGGPWRVDGRLDLLWDRDALELLEGFEGLRAPQVWADPERPNLDRADVQVLAPRNGRLRWNARLHEGGDGPPVLRGRLGRLHPGPSGDATPVRMVVRTAGPDGVELARVEAPPVPEDPQCPAGVLREGPGEAFAIDLTRAARTGAALELLFEGAAPGVDDVVGLLALHSPRIEQTPRAVRPGEHPLRFERALRLAAQVDPSLAGEPRPFATRTELLDPEQAPVVDELVTLAPVVLEAQFAGKSPRHALALLDGARWETEVTVPRGASLQGALALDARVPAGASAALDVHLDGTLLATLEAHADTWEPFALPLPAGRHRLALLARTLVPPEGTVKRTEADFERRALVPTVWTARTLRLGLSDLRVAWPASVRRRAASIEQPSVLVLHVETLRADVLPPWGGRPDVAPNVARLARAGRAYDVAIAPSPWTLPSTATLFTGLPPTAHGVVDPARGVLPDSLATLAERAREQGVVTAAVVTNALLAPGTGFERGFSSYVPLLHHNAREVGELLASFAAGHVGQQWLLFAHYFDPHMPADPPAAWAERFADPAAPPPDVPPRELEQRAYHRIAAGETMAQDDPDVAALYHGYLADVAYLDHQIGELLSRLDRLGVLDTTVVVFTADHGEAFGEHGLLGHGSQMYDEALRVPLVVAGPGALSGWAEGGEREGAGAGRVQQVVGTGGLFAEILGWLDVPFDAQSALPELEADAERPAAVAETDRGLLYQHTGDGVRLADGDPFKRSLRAVRTAEHLLVWHLPVPAGVPGGGEDERWELFDLRDDPGAQRPLPAVGQQAEWHRRRLLEALEWAAERAVEGPEAGTSAELVETLRKLGYLPGGDTMRAPPPAGGRR